MSDLEQDAMRYRWLRDSNYELFRSGVGEGAEPGMIDALMVCIIGGDEGVAQCPDPKEVDAVIDAAMRRWPYHAPTTH